MNSDDSMSVTELPLSSRAKNALTKAKIDTIFKLRRTIEEGLLRRVRNAGKKTQKEILSVFSEISEIHWVGYGCVASIEPKASAQADKTGDADFRVVPPTGWSVCGEFPNATLQRWDVGALTGEWPICQQEAISLGHALISKLPPWLSRNVDDLAKFSTMDNPPPFV